jgi:flavin-binding protein dodecin
MADSVYKVIELIGTSTESWEKAAENAVAQASQTVRDLRIAEVVEMDMQLEGGKVARYRTKVRLSFRYH